MNMLQPEMELTASGCFFEICYDLSADYRLFLFQLRYILLQNAKNIDYIL